MNTTETDAPHGATLMHNHGFVSLELISGNDLDIVNAARVSFAKRSDWETRQVGRVTDARLNDADAGLINFLMKFRHGTPYEMVWLKWHIKAPIFVFREWHRHRAASINEMSGRYVELKPEFYLPDDEHVRVQTGKPGAYVYEPMGVETLPKEFWPTFDVREGDTLPPYTYGAETRNVLLDSYEHAFSAYRRLLAIGIAKEIARTCLPVATYSEMYWACNLRGLLNFLSLRNHERAQREIRDYAEVMENIVSERLPYSMSAFVENGRVAP